MSIFDIPGAVVDAAHSAIESLSHLFVPFAGTAAAALAIVVFTILIRLLISPLTYQQVRGQRRQAALAPQIEKLREKHGGDPMKLATETLALQRANRASPFAALLPALIQAPFFMVMYHVALNAPAGSLFGIPLTAHLAAGLPIFAVLLLAAGSLAWWSSRRMSRTMSTATPPSQSKTPPNQGKTPPSLSKTPPNQGKTPLSLSKTPPNQSKTPPSQGKMSPGKTPTSQGGTSSQGGASGRDGASGRGGTSGRGGKSSRGGAQGPSKAGLSNTGLSKMPGQSKAPGQRKISHKPDPKPAPNPLAFMRFLPYLAVLAVAWMPLAGGLYLVTSTAWTALEQVVYRRPT